MPTPKWTVTVNGKKVTRRSLRPYAFAIVATRDFDYDWKRAGQQHIPSWEKNYAYALGGWRKYENTSAEIEAHEIQEAKVQAMGSFAVYLEDVIANIRRRLETHRAAGGYDAHVEAWSQRLDSAEKTARHLQLNGYKNVTLVPVGGTYLDGKVSRAATTEPCTLTQKETING
jgi:hypothetical protein